MLLAIDIGTSGCKLTLFREDGTPAAFETEGYPLYTPAPGCVEQDADEWWAAVCRACRRLLEKSGAAPGEIAGVGIDGQSWSAIPVDREGRVLRRTPIWMDTRAKDVCRRYEARIGKDAIFQVSGNPFSPSYTLPKVLYYMENEPEIVRDAAYILQSNSFLVYRLTGKVSQDLSQSYGWSCFDQKKLCWDDALTKAFGIDPRFLLETVPSQTIVGGVTKQAAGLTGLLEGTPVAAGGLDAACSTLGVGVTRPGQTQEQGGQAGGMSICVGSPVSHPALILSPHVVPGLWLLQGGTAAGGGSLKWFAGQFGARTGDALEASGKDLFQKLSAEAETSRPGANGLVFLPYLNGERSPIWDAEARGAYLGARFSTTHADFVRATMEGVAFSLRHNLDLAAEAGACVSELRATGGSANSVVWTQIKADATGLPMVVPASDTAAACGAAILAGVGVGVYKSALDAAEKIVKIRRTQEPNRDLRRVYDAYYQIYRRLYPDTKDLMRAIGAAEVMGGQHS
jgi:xylulokinase